MDLGTSRGRRSPRFHVVPGQAVAAGQPIATNHSVHGAEQNVLAAPANGVVLGITTLPTVKPGEPVCHLADWSSLKRIRSVQQSQRRTNLSRRVREQLATNIAVSDRRPRSGGVAVAGDGALGICLLIGHSHLGNWPVALEVGPSTVLLG